MVDSVQPVIIGFIVFAVINVAVLVWLFVDHKKSRRPRSHVYHPTAASSARTPELNIDMSHIEYSAEQLLQSAVESSKDRLQQSINTSIDKVASRIEQVADTTVSQEFEKYKVTLGTLQTQSVEEFSKLERELHAKHEELLKSLETQVAAEAEKRIDMFNERLNDVVASYLAETLGDNVDLGAQATYIMQTLEQHKDDIKRDTLA